MSSVTTPTTPTLNTTVQAITTLARNARLRSTTGLDLRTKLAGMLHVRLGRGGTTALSAGVNIYLEPLVNAGARIHPVQIPVGFTPDLTAAASTTCANTGNTVGLTTLTVASTTSFAAGDLICIQDSAGSPTTATEWHRVLKVTNSTTLELCEPLESAHANTGHTVRNRAECYTFPVGGGQAYALVVDYGAQSTGDTLTVEAIVETQDSMTSS